MIADIIKTYKICINQTIRRQREILYIVVGRAYKIIS